MENNFIKDIGDLYRLHYIAKEYDHLIKLNNEEWRLFEPSKFIYAYFTFNSLYNFDWEESIKNKNLTSFSKKNTDKNKDRDTVKYKAMIDFIFNRINKTNKELFFEIILDGDNINNIIQTISKISPDNYIKDSEIRNFKKEFKKLISSKEILIGKLKGDIIRLVYLVRNNIFHGTKNTIEISEKFQRKRLKVYTNILIAVNELLFKVLEQDADFEPLNDYKLKFK